jgi:hypothetical protein
VSLRKPSNIAFVIEELNRGEEVAETTIAAAADDVDDLSVCLSVRMGAQS